MSALFSPIVIYIIHRNVEVEFVLSNSSSFTSVLKHLKFNWFVKTQPLRLSIILHVKEFLS